MDIERFKQQHREILQGINSLRELAKAGVASSADKIVPQLNALNRIITQHLAIEDRILYPMLQKSSNDRLAQMSKNYQDEMAHVANPFITFARKWSTVKALQKDPDAFRAEANVVLKRVYERLRKEDKEFYPTIESSSA